MKLEKAITKELLKSIDMEHDYSPAQLMEGEEPTRLIKCASGYWAMLDFGEYLKDEKGRLIVFDEKEVRIGRARYLVNFKDQIFEEKVQKEVRLLKDKVDKKLKELLPPLKSALQYAGLLEVGITVKMLINVLIDENNRSYEARVEQAKKMVDGNTLVYYNTLLRLQEEKEYDSLYIHLFQDGMPCVVSLDNNFSELLVKYFHRDNIFKTIEDMQSKDHIYNVAKFNIEKAETLKHA